MKRTPRIALLALVTIAAGAGIGVAISGTWAQDTAPEPAPADATRFPEHIVVPPRLGRIETDLVDIHGDPVTVACSTCHSARYAPMKRYALDVNAFHGGLTFSHGAIVCASCHDPDNRDLLRLASGDTLPFAQVLDLCAQCHGPQYRDYKHGAHGGMQGFWDRTRGPGTRNNCVHCHDPHAPAYPTVFPEPPPRDTRPDTH